MSDRDTKIVFVTGTDTDVGKTVVASLLVYQLVDEGVDVRPLKPFCSGGRGDVEALREAARRRWALDEINPYSFASPLTPAVAAKEEQREISLSECLGGIKAAARGCELLLVEGAGGLMSPLGKGYDSLRLIVELGAQPVLVATNRIGVINQVLMALSVMGNAGCPPAVTVLSDRGAGDPSVVSNRQVLQELRPELHFLELPHLEKVPPEKGGGEPGAIFLKKALAGLVSRT